jgi:hypothetical protein
MRYEAIGAAALFAETNLYEDEVMHALHKSPPAISIRRWSFPFQDNGAIGRGGCDELQRIQASTSSY